MANHLDGDVDGTGERGVVAVVFWRSLYLPELQNHATYLANQLLMIDKADKDFKNNPELKNWIIDASHINVITDPQQIPSFQ